MKVRKTTKLIHEGKHAAEVEIELLEEDHRVGAVHLDDRREEAGRGAFGAAAW